MPRDRAELMGERLSALFPLLLLAALAGLTFWLNEAVQLPVVDAAATRRHDPDYIVDGLTAYRMNPEGEVVSKLFAEKTVHYPDDDTTHLTRPRWVSLAQGKAPVTITANEGLVSSDGDNVYFEDDVHVVRDPSGKQSRLTLLTSYLQVIPDKNIAQTDRPVTITDANTVVHAIGLELNGDTRILKLLSNVKGTYYEAGREAAESSGR
jgi:lipopolysaccharide export system protein LptC